MAAPTQLVLSDFLGGIKEGDNLAPEDLTPRQWSQLRGFVLEDEVSLRTQWPLQRVARPVAPSGAEWIAGYPFRGRTADYLIAVDAAGALWWRTAPAPAATSAEAKATVWTALLDGAGNAPVAEARYRFLCTQPFTDPTSKVSRAAVRVHCAEGTAPCLLIHESDTDSGLIATAMTDFWPESKAISLRGNWVTGTAYAKDDYVAGPDGGWYRCLTGHTSSAEFASDGDKWVVEGADLNPKPQTSKAPRANVGVMWGDTLLLADTWWLADTSAEFSTPQKLTADNTKRFRNGIWFSVAGTTDTFRPSSILTGAIGADAIVLDLLPIPAGLLVLTTSATGRDGLVLFRGTPSNFQVEVLRGGLGRPDPVDDITRPHAALWADAGSVVFIGDDGAVWHTNGSDAARLDMVGPAKPATGGIADHAAALGPYLFVSRAGRLLAFRAFSDSGSWTELTLPAGMTVRSMFAAGACLYFTTTAGEMWRFTLEEVPGERGTADGAVLDLTVGTGPQDVQQPTMTKLWGTVDVRASGLSDGAELVAVAQRTAALGVPDAVEVSTPVGVSLGRRAQVKVPGLGPSAEYAALLTFRGDVRVESLAVTYRPGRVLR